MYSSKVPSLYTRNSYMETHQAGYMMNPAFVYEEGGHQSTRSPPHVGQQEYAYAASQNSGVYHTIQDDRNPDVTFKSSNNRKRTIALICVLLLVLVIIAVGVALGVILSKDKEKDKTSPRSTESRFRGEGTLSDKTWSPDYLDSSSQLYQATEQEFIDKVDTQMSQSTLGQYYQRTNVIGFREGSVIIVFDMIFLSPEQETFLVASILNELIVIPNFTSVTVSAIFATTSTTTSTSTSTTMPTTSTTAQPTSTTTTSTTTSSTVPTTSTTSSPSTTTTSTPKPITSSPTSTTTSSTASSTSTVTTKATTSTTNTTTKASSATSSTTPTSTTSTITTTTTTTTTTKTPQPPPTTTTSTSQTTTTTTTVAATTTTSIIPVCSEGFSPYTVLLEHKREYSSAFLDIQSNSSIGLKEYLENWGTSLLSDFGAISYVETFTISDFGPPLTDSTWTLATVRVCIEDSSGDVQTITSLLGIYMGFLPDFNDVGLSDVFDVMYEYLFTYDSSMADVTSQEFSDVASTLQSKTNEVIGTNNITVVYVKRLEPMESNDNIKAIMRLATTYQGTSLANLNTTLSNVAKDDAELSFISIEQS